MPQRVYLAQKESAALLPGPCRPSQQIGCLHAEGTRKTVNHVDARGILAAFDRADVRAVQVGAMRQLFLRESLISPIFPHIERQDLSDVHAREGSVLLSISPRSILYKMTFTGCRFA